MHKPITPPIQKKHNNYRTASLTIRDTRLDTIKGLLIILVVFGHLLESFFTNRINIIVYNIIYSFHMPLFVIISGYFFNPNQSFEKLKASSFKLAETFFFFYFIHQCINYVELGPLSANDLIIPPFTMWYLWAFIFWRITAWLAFNNKKCTKASILIVFSMSLAIGLLPIRNELSIQRFFAFAFFFVIGIYMRENQLKPKKILLISCIPVLFAGCYVLIKFKGSSFDDLRWIFYYNQPYGSISDALLRFMSLILGLSISILLWNAIKDNRMISKIGTSTLSIYMMHPLLIKCYSHYAETYYLPHDIISLLLLSLSMVFGIYLISQSRCIEFVLNPFSCSLKSIRRTRVRI